MYTPGDSGTAESLLEKRRADPDDLFNLPGLSPSFVGIAFNLAESLRVDRSPSSVFKES